MVPKLDIRFILRWGISSGKRIEIVHPSSSRTTMYVRIDRLLIVLLIQIHRNCRNKNRNRSRWACAHVVKEERQRSYSKLERLPALRSMPRARDWWSKDPRNHDDPDRPHPPQSSNAVTSDGTPRGSFSFKFDRRRAPDRRWMDGCERHDVVSIAGTRSRGDAPAAIDTSPTYR
jgi:hypothetical protein